MGVCVIAEICEAKSLRIDRHGVRRVLIAYDADAAGDAAADKLAPRLIGEGFDVYRCRFPKGMDANAYALSVKPAAKSLGLVFKLPVELRRIARDSGVRLKQWNGEGSFDLPMPTLIVLDRERRIRSVRWAFRTADLDPESALAALSHFA